MYETVFDVSTLVLIVVATVACAVHKRSVTRQVDEVNRQMDELRTEVACARIEGVLGQQPRAGEKPSVPAPARGQG
ncbi:MULTISPECIES: hypothetical protein [Streptomyces]|uniref:Secreted protein n=1 Tax=Streptomyces erythrochromogenes TaxID=285574 RepID=A0ABZ1QFA2_9ACTN|nr:MULTISPECIES: hypothetical protein [Streptomyces]